MIWIAIVLRLCRNPSSSFHFAQDAAPLRTEVLLQKLQPALEYETDNHVVDDPLDWGEVIGEDGGRLVAIFEVGVRGGHGRDQ